MRDFKTPLIVIVALAASACASTTAPANPHQAAALRPATQQRDPAPAAAPQVPPGAVIGPPAPAATRTPRTLGPPIAQVAAANRKALEEPTSTGYINAVQVYPFADNALYRLYAAPQQVTDVVLQPGETLTAISAGDTVRWAVGDTASGSGPSKQIHVLVKPFGAGLKTNLVILTDRRTYHLVLQSTDRIAMAAISWSYADSGLVSQKGTDAIGSPPVASGVAVENLNFQYKITGDKPAWRPLRAFDDGHKVYIEFPRSIAQGDAPPLFVVGANGGSDLVNYRVRGNYYVIDRLFGAAELRLGQDEQQIVRITRMESPKGGATLAGLFGGP
jgi:P-type conjugative transfer protein TrbG